MAKIYQNLTELIGHTPLLELAHIEKEDKLAARIIVKLERTNPGGSVKDRVALAMIEDAERRGLLQPGATIIEPTSGNTGIGIAWVGTVKGYKTILTMPETMSIERQNLLKALGASIVLTPGSKGMSGAIAEAEHLRDTTPGSIILGQFDNPANPAAHRATTAEELWEDTDGEIDIFVGGVGTGGTVSGVAGMLKKKKPSLQAFAVEPASSPVISEGKSGPHNIQGIGANFVPANYDSSTIDGVITITDDEAIGASRRLAREEGMLVGISSGAAVAAALKLAAKPAHKGKTIVALLPDTGERYLSTVLYDFEGHPL